MTQLNALTYEMCIEEGPCLRKPPVDGDDCARQGLETLQVSDGGNLIAGTGYSRVDELRDRSRDGATTQRSATARKPVAPGLEADRRRWLLRAEPCHCPRAVSGTHTVT